MSHKKGFTLLEILLVVGIIAVLAGIVIIAINPSKQLATVRNTERASNLKQIYNAMQQYYIDHGVYPGIIPSTLTEICNTGSVSATTTSVTGAPCDTLVNLSDLVPTYLVAIPVDPQGSPVALLTNIAHADTIGTGYLASVDGNNKVTVQDMAGELGVTHTYGPAVVATPSTLGNGLIAHYLMNDVGETATVLDTKGTHNGTATQNVSLMSTTSGRVNNALYFNDATKVNIGQLFASGGTYGAGDGFSASVWHTMDGWMDNRSYAIVGGEATRPVLFDLLDHLSTDNGYINIRLLSDGGGPGMATGDIIPRPGPGVWQHIAVTVDASGNGKVYVDGELKYSTTGQNKPVEMAQTVLIGKQNPWNSYYKGNLDDLRIYNRALTQTEVTQLAAGTEAE